MTFRSNQERDGELLTGEYGEEYHALMPGSVT
jgi:hypothetical protein